MQVAKRGRIDAKSIDESIGNQIQNGKIFCFLNRLAHFSEKNFCKLTFLPLFLAVFCLFLT
jgi:hypothetical protein